MSFPLHLAIVHACVVVIPTLKSFNIVMHANVNVMLHFLLLLHLFMLLVHVPTNVHVLITALLASVLMWMLIPMHLLMCRCTYYCSHANFCYHACCHAYY